MDGGKRMASNWEVILTPFLSDGEMLHALPKMSDEAFDEFCFSNSEFRIEQDPQGNIFIMPLSSYKLGSIEAELIGNLGLWDRRTKLGKVFSSSTLFKLPDGSKRMPDAAWISLEKHNRLSEKERKSFARIVPDFVIEVRSPSDRLKTLQTQNAQDLDCQRRPSRLAH